MPCGHRLLWARLDLPFPFQLLTVMLIAFHGCKISDPELFPQGSQPASSLYKAYGIRIAQHRRADRSPGEPRSLAQSIQQESETIFSQRMPPFREQEQIPCLWHCGLLGRRETGLIQIGAHGSLPVRRQGHGAGVPSFPAHPHRSASAVHIREM